MLIVQYIIDIFLFTQLNIIHKARNGPLTNGHTKIVQYSMPVLTNKNIKDLTIINVFQCLP